MFTWPFWKDVGERSIRTFCAAFAAWLTTNETDWLHGLTLAGIATLYSVLANIGTHGITGNGPSFTSVYKGAKDDDSGD